MARTEKKTVTLDQVMVDAAVAEVEGEVPDFLKGQVPTNVAVHACIRQGIIAMRKERLGEDVDLSDVPYPSNDQRRG